MYQKCASASHKSFGMYQYQRYYSIRQQNFYKNRSRNLFSSGLIIWWNV